MGASFALGEMGGASWNRHCARLKLLATKEGLPTAWLSLS